MPLMSDLISKLNDTPPQSEGELRELLNETGYDLIMSEPSMDGGNGRGHGSGRRHGYGGSLYEPHGTYGRAYAPRNGQAA